MLYLEIYDRIGVVFKYRIGYDTDAFIDTKPFTGKKKDFYNWIENKATHLSPLEKECVINKVGFALDLHFPRHHYRFINE